MGEKSRLYQNLPWLYNGPKEYSYTSSFGDIFPSIEIRAKNNTAIPGLDSDGYIGGKIKILNNVKVLMDGARRAEEAFLAESGIPLTPQTAKTILENFNLILNSQKLFERNLAIFQQLDEGVQNKLIEPSKFFHTYFNEAIEKFPLSKNFDVNKPVDVEGYANKVIGYAIEKTYANFIEVLDEDNKRKGVEGHEVDKYKSNIRLNDMNEIIEVIRRLRSLGIFGKYASLFNIDAEGLKKNYLKKDGTMKVKKPKATIYSFNQGGTPLELITSTVAAGFAQIHQNINNGFIGLTITGAQTGGGNYNQQKGDSIIAYAKGTVNFKQMEEVFKKHSSFKGSKRAQNIKAMSEYLQKFGNQIKHLVVISDKNNFINVDYKGAKAQDATSLKDAEAMFSAFHVGGDIEQLINFLANCGDDMIQGDSDGYVKTMLASYIGYFLFDHVEITGKISQTNVVNIINVSGTYIPLSVFLEGFYNSLVSRLTGLTSDPGRLVTVGISYGGNLPEDFSQSSFETFRSNRESSTKLKYKVMRDIASYITDLMK